MIKYTTSVDGITADQLKGFFAGWPSPPSPETHLALLRGSSRVVLARTSEGRVVGFVTAISDGVMNAHIPLLEVLPEFQRQGIGTELMRKVLEILGGLYAVDTTCDPELVPFYRRLGLGEATAMIARRPDRIGAPKS